MNCFFAGFTIMYNEKKWWFFIYIYTPEKESFWWIKIFLIGFGLVWFGWVWVFMAYKIIVGYLMPNPVYVYIY